jgi:hypothetical protein
MSEGFKGFDHTPPQDEVEENTPDVLAEEPEPERFRGIGEYDADGLRDLIREVRSSY